MRHVFDLVCIILFSAIGIFLLAILCAAVYGLSFLAIFLFKWVMMGVIVLLAILGVFTTTITMLVLINEKMGEIFNGD